MVSGFLVPLGRPQKEEASMNKIEFIEFDDRMLAVVTHLDGEITIAELPAEEVARLLKLREGPW